MTTILTRSEADMPPTLRSQVIASLMIVGLSGHVSIGQDKPPTSAVAAKEAEAEYLRARLARVEAEIALETYVGTTLPREVAAAEARLTQTRADLDRARFHFAWTERMVDQGWPSPNHATIARLTLDVAKFEFEKAETAQAVLNRYTGDKTTKELRSAVEKAASLEADSEAAYDKARAQPSAQSSPPPAG